MDNKGYVLLFFLAKKRNEKEKRNHQGSLLAMSPVNDLLYFSKDDIWLILTHFNGPGQMHLAISA